MRSSPRLLVVGSLVMDLIVSTPRFPSGGETVIGSRFQTAPGGKGANQAIQAARLGASVSMAGKIGDDQFGQEMRDSLLSSGVDTAFLTSMKGISSGIGNVQLETGDGKTDNRIVVVPGANMEIRPEDVKGLKGTISDYDMVLLQLEIPLEINQLVADYAAEAGVPVMLNSAPYAPIPDRLACRLSYISPNEHEAEWMTGIPVKDMDSARRATARLREMGADNALITLGNRGAVLETKNGFYHSPCVPDVEVKDPTAAGDSFVGAFCTAVCRGISPEEALRFANYTAALTVSRMGAQPSLPELPEVLALMESRGERIESLQALLYGKERVEVS